MCEFFGVGSFGQVNGIFGMEPAAVVVFFGYLAYALPFAVNVCPDETGAARQSGRKVDTGYPGIVIGELSVVPDFGIIGQILPVTGIDNYDGIVFNFYGKIPFA